MTEPMDTFYTYASKAIVEDILKSDGEYFSRTRYMESELKRINAILEEGIASRVNDLLAEQAAIDELRECAYFRAGFRMALELTR